MQKTTRTWIGLAIVAVAIALCTLTSCNMDELLGKNKKPASVTLDKQQVKYDSLAIAAGQVVTLVPTVRLKDGTAVGSDVKWVFSVDESYYEVVYKGNDRLEFLIKKPGSWYVQASALHDGAIVASSACTVIVGGAVESLQITAAGTGITSTRMGEGTTKELSAVILPATATQDNVSWTVSDDSVISVTRKNQIDGKIVILTALGPGTAVLTLSSVDNPSVRQTMSVTVVASIVNTTTDPTSMTLDSSTMTIAPPWSGRVVESTVKDGYNHVVTSGSVSWSSSDTSVATVTAISDRSARINPINGGDAVITATVDGFAAVASRLYVSVTGALQRIGTNSDTMVVVKDTTSTLGVTYLPTNTTQTAITATSDAPTVATVTAVDPGRVTVLGVSAGSARVTIASASNPTITKTVLVKVREPEQSKDTPIGQVSVTPATLELNPPFSQGQGSVSASVLDATGNLMPKEGVTFSLAEGEGVVSIAADGNTVAVTPLKGGSAILKATSATDGAFSATCPIFVGGNLRDLVPQFASAQMKGGSDITVRLTPYPSDAIVGDIAWTTSDKAIATVVGNGLSAVVSAVGAGSATIGFSSGDAKGSVEVQVMPVSDAKARTITLGSYFVSMAQDASPTVIDAVVCDYAADGTAVPIAGAAKTIEWECDDSQVLEIATLDDGSVLARPRNSGVATLVARTSLNSAVSASCRVEVGASAALGSKLRILHPSSPYISVTKGTTTSVGIAYIPFDTTSRDVIWVSSDNTVASVATNTSDQAKATITAYKAGSATITATSRDDLSISATFSVTVSDDTTVIDNTYTSLRFGYKDKFVSVVPAKAGTSAITLTKHKVAASGDGSTIWTYGGPVEIVSGADVILAVENSDETKFTFIPRKSGVAVIRCTYAGNPQITGQCTIQVAAADEVPDTQLKAIVLETGSAVLTVGDQATFLFDTLAPGHVPQMAWTSSDSSVASARAVDGANQVVVSAKALGKATISGLSAEGIGCSMAVSVTNGGIVDPAVTKVELDRHYLSYDIASKDLQTITAKVFRAGIASLSDNVVWSVDNPDLLALGSTASANSVTVNPLGKTGRTLVRATAADNPSVAATCVVELVDSTVVAPTLRAIALSHSSFLMEEGTTRKIDHTLVPSGSQATLMWSSSDQGVATVAADGTVSALASGQATITAMAEGGVKATASLSVSSRAATVVPSLVSLRQDGKKVPYAKLQHDSEPLVLEAVVISSDGKAMAGQDVSFAVTGADGIVSHTVLGNGSSIAISPLSSGSATVKVFLDSNPALFDTVLVEVGASPVLGTDIRRIVPVSSSVTLEPGNSTKVGVTLVPADTTQAGLGWSSDDTTVASVDAEGTVTAHKVGTAMLSVRSLANPQVMATILVRCTPAGTMSRITLDKHYLSYDKAGKALASIRATAWRAQSDGKLVQDPTADIVWQSMDESVAGISASGNTALVNPDKSRTGSTWVKAMIRGQQGVYASCLVEVVDTSAPPASVRSVRWSSESAVAAIGVPLVLAYEAVGAASQANVTWTVDASGPLGDESAHVVHDAQARTATVTLDSTCQVSVTATIGNASATTVVRPSSSGLVVPSAVMLDRQYLHMAMDSNPVAVRASAIGTDGLSVAGSYTFASSDDQVVAITDIGGNRVSLAPVNSGSAIISATLNEDPTLVATMMVDVGASAAQGPGVRQVLMATPHVSLPAGGTAMVQAMVIPSDAAASLYWTSSDASIATVASTNGKDVAEITAIRRGQVTITATSADDPSLSATMTVDVAADGTVAKVEIDRNAFSYDLASKSLPTMTATVWRQVAGKLVRDDGASVTWSSSNPRIADVVQNGRRATLDVKRSAVGSAWVTATSAEDGNVGASAFVEVIDTSGSSTARALAWSSSASTMRRGQVAVLSYFVVPESYALDAAIEAYATDLDGQDVSVTSIARITHDPLARQVRVVALRPGTVAITASAGAATSTATIGIVAVDAVVPYSLRLSKTYLRMGHEDEGKAITATVTGSDGRTMSTPVTFSVPQGQSIVALSRNDDSTATLVPLDAGSVLVTATCDLDTSISASVLVEVGASPSLGADLRQIVASTTGIALAPGEETDVHVSLIPLGTTQTQLSWSTSDSSVATISATDKAQATVKAVGEGKATVTATSLANPSVKATIAVTCSKTAGITSIALDRSHISYDKAGKALPMISATAYRTAGGTTSVDTSASVTWASSDENVVRVQSRGLSAVVMVDDAKEGTAWITATSTTDPAVSASCLVEVTDTSEASVARALAWSSTSSAMRRGQVSLLSYSIVPQSYDGNADISVHATDADGQETDAASVARITHDPLARQVRVVALRQGTVAITATAGMASSSTLVTVAQTDTASPSSMRLSHTYLSMGHEDEGKAITATVTATDGTTMSTPVTFSAPQGQNIVALSRNNDNTTTLTPLDAGSVLVTATCDFDASVSASVLVEVGASPALGADLRQILPSTAGIALVPGQETDVHVSLIPLDTTQTSIAWATSDSSVAIVSATGKDQATVRAIGEGKATITATSLANPSVKASVAVSSSKTAGITRISLDRSHISYDMASKALPMISATAYRTAGGTTSVDTSASVTWASSDENVVRVQSRGLSAVVMVDDAKEGTAWITATSTTDAAVSAACLVEVTDTSGLAQLRSVTWESSSWTLPVGSSRNISYTPVPALFDGDITLGVSMDQEGIATISHDPVARTVGITANKPGILKVTASKGSVSATTIATLVPQGVGLPASIRLDQDFIRLAHTSAGVVLRAKIYDTTGQEVPGTVTFGTSGPALATVTPLDDGLGATIRPVGDSGMMYVTATSDDDPTISARAMVEVGASSTMGSALKALLVRNGGAYVALGDSIGISYMAIPTTSARTAIEASSSDKDIVAVSVDTDGNVSATAVGIGSATVTISSYDDPRISGTCTVTVGDRRGLSLVDTSLSFLAYDKASKALPRISADVLAYDGQGVLAPVPAKVQWSTSGDLDLQLIPVASGAVAIVVGDQAEGSAIVRATAADNPQVWSRVLVEVVDATADTQPRSVSWGENSSVMYVGDTRSLSFTVQPSSYAGTATAGANMYDPDGKAKKIANVQIQDRTATVQALESGKVVLTAVAGTVSGTTTITVTERPVQVPAYIALDRNYVHLPYASGVQDIRATVYGADGLAMASDVAFGASDASIVSVTDNADGSASISPLSSGRTTVDAYSVRYPRIRATAVVEVGAQDTGLALRELIAADRNLSVALGDKMATVVSFVPSDTTSKALQWASGDESVATVAPGGTGVGIITARKTGSTTITATSVSNPSLSQEIVVTVTQGRGVASVSLDKSYVSYDKASKALPTLQAVAMRYNGTTYEADPSQEIVWSVVPYAQGMDSGITIVPTGRNAVIDVSKAPVGRAYVVATSASNPAASAKCLVEVVDSSTTPSVRAIVWDSLSSVLRTGQEKVLSYTLVPDTSDVAVLSSSTDTNGVASVLHDSAKKTVTVQGIKEGTLTLRLNVGEVGAVSTVHVQQSAQAIASWAQLDSTYVHIDNGASQRVVATMYDSTGRPVPASFTFAVEDNLVATLTPDGDEAVVVHARNAGRTTLTATSGNVSATAVVEVGTPPDDGSLRQLLPSSSSLVLLQGSAADISAMSIPSTAGGQLAWKSSDDAVASVASTGSDSASVQALQAGTAVITVSSVAHPAISAPVNVLVTPTGGTVDTNVSSVSLSPTAILANVGDGPSSVSAMVLGQNGKPMAGRSVSWRLSGDDCLTNVVLRSDSATFTPASPGVADIIATADDNPIASAIAKVVVLAAGEQAGDSLLAIVPRSSSLTMVEGNQEQMEYSLIPSQAKPSIRWYSSDEGVATVSKAAGKNAVYISAMGEGVATLTAKASALDNPSLSQDVLATTTVYVVKEAFVADMDITGVSVDPSYLAYTVSKGLPTMTATVWRNTNGVQAPDASEAVRWSLGGDKAGVISASGNTVSIGADTSKPSVTRVTATSVSNPFATSFGVVEVLPMASEPRAIRLSSQSMNMAVGATVRLGTTVVPEIPNLAVVWATSDASVATVTADGTVRAIAPGNVAITATLRDWPHIQDRCMASVSMPSDSSVASVQMDKRLVNIVHGDKAVRISATAYDREGSPVVADIAFATSNPGVVTVTPDGKASALLTGTGAGVAEVTATSVSGAQASTTVVVGMPSLPGQVLALVPDVQSTSLAVGESLDVNVAFVPSDYGDTSLAWETLAPSVVSVRQGDGTKATLTALAPGEAIVRATSIAQPDMTASVRVKVYQQSIVDTSIVGVRSSTSSLVMSVGDDMQVQAWPVHADGSNAQGGVSWAISQDSDKILSLSSDGLEASVLANAAGKASLVATSKLNPDARTTVAVRVLAQGETLTQLTDIIPSMSAVTIEEGSALDITWSTLAPGLDPVVRWSSTDNAVATAVQGSGKNSVRISANDSGSATIIGRASAADNPALVMGDDIVCAIVATIVPKGQLVDLGISRVTLDKSHLGIDLANKPAADPHLVASVWRKDAQDSTAVVNWSSSDESVAKVPATGKDVGVTYSRTSTGVATVTATAAANPWATAQAVVSVTETTATGTLAGATLSHTSLLLQPGESAQLQAYASPQNLAGLSTTWSSSDPTVAKVSANGTISAVASGNASVSATITDGKGGRAVATCAVTVARIVVPSGYSAVTVDSQTLDLSVSPKPTKVKATVLSHDGTTSSKADVTWTVPAQGEAGHGVVAVEGYGQTAYVTALRPGRAVVRASVTDAPTVSATIVVSVGGALSSLTPKAEHVGIVTGYSATIGFTRTPSDAVVAADDVSYSIQGTAGGKDVARIVSYDSTSAVVQALQPGSAVLKAAALGKEASVRISVQDSTQSKGGISGMTLSSQYVRANYPYETTTLTCTSSYYDGSSSIYEPVSWATSDNSVLRLESVGNTVRATPLKPGTATVTATSLLDPDIKASCLFEAKGLVQSIVPSSSSVGLYTGGSMTLSVTPDESSSASTSYKWEIIGDAATQLTLIDHAGTSRTKTIAAADVDLADSKYEDPDVLEQLYAQYPKKATVRVTLADDPSVSCTIDVTISLLPRSKHYPKAISLNATYMKLTPPFSNPTSFTATVTDQDGNKMDATIDWYYDMDSSQPDADDPDRFKGYISAEHTVSNDLVVAVVSNNDTVLVTPQLSGYHRLTAVVRENPRYSLTCTLLVGGDVTGIVPSTQTPTMTAGSKLSIGATLTPANALAHKVWWALESSVVAAADGSYTAYDEDKAIKFETDGNNVFVTAKELASTEYPYSTTLYVEYFDNATDALLRANPEQYRAIRARTAPLYTKKVFLTVNDKAKTVYSPTISPSVRTVNPKAITADDEVFTISMDGSGTFANWDIVDIKLTPDVAKTMSRVQDKISVKYDLTRIPTTADPIVVSVSKKDPATLAAMGIKDDSVINEARSLLYLGGPVSAVRPGSVSGANGSGTKFNYVISETGNDASIYFNAGDGITVGVKYNPDYTHQQGVVWQVVNDEHGCLSVNAGANDGTTSTCTLTSRSSGTSEDGKGVLRAVSIYDPGWPEGVVDKERGRLAVPYQDVVTRGLFPANPKFYTDFNITVFSLIKGIGFTTATQDVVTQGPGVETTYETATDKDGRPLVTKSRDYATVYNEKEGRSFLVEAALEPDLARQVEFRLTGDGADYGTLVTTGLEKENTFRFIPYDARTFGPVGFQAYYGDDFSYDFSLVLSSRDFYIVNRNIDLSNWRNEWDTYSPLGYVQPTALQSMQTVVLRKGDTIDLDIQMGDPFEIVDGKDMRGPVLASQQGAKLVQWTIHDQPYTDKDGNERPGQRLLGNNVSEGDRVIDFKAPGGSAMDGHIVALNEGIVTLTCLYDPAGIVEGGDGGDGNGPNAHSLDLTVYVVSQINDSLVDALTYTSSSDITFNGYHLGDKATPQDKLVRDESGNVISSYDQLFPKIRNISRSQGVYRDDQVEGGSTTAPLGWIRATFGRYLGMVDSWNVTRNSKNAGLVLGNSGTSIAYDNKVKRIDGLQAFTGLKKFSATGAVASNRADLSSCSSIVEFALNQSTIGGNIGPGTGGFVPPSGSLQRLVLSGNSIESFSAMAGSTYGSLAELDISQNKLTGLPNTGDSATSYRSFASLAKLDARLNTLGTCTIDGQTFPALQTLLLGGQDGSFNPTVKAMPSLQVLDISGNKSLDGSGKGNIGNISLRGDFPMLTRIDLNQRSYDGGRNISSLTIAATGIAEDMCATLPALKSIDMGLATMQTVQLVGDMPSLTTLGLDGSCVNKDIVLDGTFASLADLGLLSTSFEKTSGTDIALRGTFAKLTSVNLDHQDHKGYVKSLTVVGATGDGTLRKADAAGNHFPVLASISAKGNKIDSINSTRPVSVVYGNPIRVGIGVEILPGKDASTPTVITKTALRSLVTLDLEGNKLSGSWLDDKDQSAAIDTLRMPVLQVLDICSQDSYMGRTEVQGITTLREIRATGDRMEGLALKDLPVLASLDLSGTVTSDLSLGGNLGKLASVTLAGSAITGSKSSSSGLHLGTGAGDKLTSLAQLDLQNLVRLSGVLDSNGTVGLALIQANGKALEDVSLGGTYPSLASVDINANTQPIQGLRMDGTYPSLVRVSAQSSQIGSYSFAGDHAKLGTLVLATANGSGANTAKALVLDNSKATRPFGALKTVDANGAQLQEIRLVGQFPQLLELKASYNNVSTLASSATGDSALQGGNFSMLSVVDVSNNSLSTFPMEGTFASVTKLDVSDNKIAVGFDPTVGGGRSFLFPKATELDISSNSMGTAQGTGSVLVDEVSFPKLMTLDMGKATSSNTLASVRVQDIATLQSASLGYVGSKAIEVNSCTALTDLNLTNANEESRSYVDITIADTPALATLVLKKARANDLRMQGTFTSLQDIALVSMESHEGDVVLDGTFSVLPSLVMKQSANLLSFSGTFPMLQLVSGIESYGNQTKPKGLPVDGFSMSGSYGSLVGVNLDSFTGDGNIQLQDVASASRFDVVLSNSKLKQDTLVFKGSIGGFKLLNLDESMGLGYLFANTHGAVFDDTAISARGCGMSSSPGIAAYGDAQPIYKGVTSLDLSGNMISQIQLSTASFPDLKVFKAEGQGIVTDMTIGTLTYKANAYSIIPPGMKTPVMVNTITDTLAVPAGFNKVISYGLPSLEQVYLRGNDIWARLTLAGGDYANTTHKISIRFGYGIPAEEEIATSYQRVQHHGWGEAWIYTTVTLGSWRKQFNHNPGGWDAYDTRGTVTFGQVQVAADNSATGLLSVAAPGVYWVSSRASLTVFPYGK